jgi:hypothetical protein
MAEFGRPAKKECKNHFDHHNLPGTFIQYQHGYILSCQQDRMVYSDLVHRGSAGDSLFSRRPRRAGCLTPSGKPDPPAGATARYCRRP